MSKIIFYSNPNELPCRRYFKFNKYIMIASDVGSSINDYDLRMKKALIYANNSDFENLKKELSNKRQTFWNALQEYSPEGCALACMVKSINGKQYPDRLSGDDIEEILNELSKTGYSIGQMQEDLRSVKKKSRANLKGISLRSLIERIRCLATFKKAN